MRLPSWLRPCIFLLLGSSLVCSASEPPEFDIDALDYYRMEISYVRPPTQHLRERGAAEVREESEATFVSRERSYISQFVALLSLQGLKNCPTGKSHQVFVAIDLESEEGRTTYLSDGARIYNSDFSRCADAPKGLLQSVSPVAALRCFSSRTGDCFGN